MEKIQTLFREYQEKFANRAARLLQQGNQEGARAMFMAASWIIDMEVKLLEEKGSQGDTDG